MSKEKELENLLESMNDNDKMQLLLKEMLKIKETFTKKDFINIYNQDLLMLFIECGVSLLHVNGSNLIYNLKYREVIAENIKSRYFSNKSNRPNGVDLNATPPAESKSVTYKTANISIKNNLKIGEIDKVYNKINDADPKYSIDTENHAFFSLYREASGIPSLTLYVNNTDFGKTIQPLLISRYNVLKTSSHNFTVKKRDSLSLTLENFKHCQSLDIADIDKSEIIFINNQFLNSINKKSPFYKKINNLIKLGVVKLK